MPSACFFLAFLRSPVTIGTTVAWMCGVCSSRCPAGISHPQVAELARRLYGKYIAPECKHLEKRVAEINEGDFEKIMQDIMGKPIAELKELYNNRDIEK